MFFFVVMDGVEKGRIAYLRHIRFDYVKVIIELMLTDDRCTLKMLKMLNFSEQPWLVLKLLVLLGF